MFGQTAPAADGTARPARKATRFLSFDTRQLALARAAGLRTA
jgi:hypothetical protein